MRVGPLPSGHVLLTLDDQQASLAELVAAQREDVIRFGRIGERLAEDDRQTHLEGACAEIAVAHFYGARYEPRVGADDGIDFWISLESGATVGAQVKSRPLALGRDAHLSLLEWDHLRAAVYFHCVTHPVDGGPPYNVMLVGYARRRRVLETPLRVVKTDEETGAKIRARRIPESALSLVAPTAIMAAMNRHKETRDGAPPVPFTWGGEARDA